VVVGRPRAAKSKIEAVTFQDNPGRPGKGRVRLIDAAPQNWNANFSEAGFTGFSGSGRTLLNANEKSGGEE